jgi:hypothetical protein
MIMRWLLYLWPLPNTLIGLCIGVCPFLGDRTYTVRRGVFCIYGPAMKRLLELAPIQGGAAAITFGHVILAADREAFDRTFEHEWIHVRQYCWWGPFFLPAYVVSSIWHGLIGEHMYVDNAFERQARKWSDDL